MSPPPGTDDEPGMRGIPAVLLIVACAILALASFLPWAQFKPQMPAGFDLASMDEFMRSAMTATGWNGNVSLLGITVPNWFVPILAFAIIGMTLMRGADIWDAPNGLSIAAAAYCLAHLTLLIAVVVANGSQVRLGFGVLLAELAAVFALGIAIFGRSSDSYEPAHPSRQQFHPAARPGRPMMHDHDDVPAPPDFSPYPRTRV